MTSQTNLEIAGTLRENSLPELLVEIFRAKLNGSLRLSNARTAEKSVVYFDAGDVVFAASNARRFRLSELLISEKKISEESRASLAGFANDLALRENLIKTGVLPKVQIDTFIARQIELILKDAFTWNNTESSGEWVFSPLVRIKGDIRFPTNAPALLIRHARNIDDDEINRKFKNLHESFAAKETMPENVDLLPEEAFVFSRFDGASLNVERAMNLSGLPVADTLRILYRLWLGGFLVRADWNAPFSERALDAIRSTNLTLKKPASSAPPVKVSETRSEAMPTVAADAENNVPVSEAIPASEEKPLPSLDEYLERVGRAQNHYQIFEVAADAPAADIKRAYFAVAKRFHPDLFHKEVDADKHRQIQNAFSRIAQAYDALKSEQSREVYDYRMRKELAQMKTQETDAPAASDEQRTRENKIERAEQEFENGFGLLMNENYDDALPFLARAAHLIPENARYRAYYGKALSADERQKHKAEAEMQTAVRLAPDSADFRLLLVEFFVQMNLLKRAEGELKRLLSIFPGNKDAKQLLDGLTKR